MASRAKSETRLNEINKLFPVPNVRELHVNRDTSLLDLAPGNMKRRRPSHPSSLPSTHLQQSQSARGHLTFRHGAKMNHLGEEGKSMCPSLLEKHSLSRFFSLVKFGETAADADATDWKSRRIHMS